MATKTWIREIINVRAIAGLLGAVSMAVIVFAAGTPTFADKLTIQTSPHPVVISNNQPTTASLPTVPVDTESIRSAKGWVYAFDDIADGALPDTDWKFEDGTLVSNYNNEAQAYTSRTDNVKVRDGTLVITAKPEQYAGKSYTSARINTYGAFSFTYGTIEVDMMIPDGGGTWPAAWLLPRNNIYKPADYGISDSDPYAWALNGEIDFAESIGNIRGENIPAAHSYNEIHGTTIYTPGFIADPYQTYHRYGVVKTPTSITFTIDGVPYASRVKTSDNPLDWPYNQPYYLILNLAVGGAWASAAGIDDASAPWELKVKSISYKPL
jgi:beta-glucanase (GH16 family)